MKITRRTFLRYASIGLASAVTPWLSACGEEDGDGLPLYNYDGPLGPEDLFAIGVASGDPTASDVILWTKLHLTESAEQAPEVFVEVATDPGFKRRVAAGSYESQPERGYAFKVDIKDLRPGTSYYYRFKALGRTSPIGRTRTAPEGAVDHLRFAACSCSNYAFGYFHSYRHLSQRADIDAVLHLGDYIYEYGNDEYGNVRECEPPHEIVTLEDYRTRYEQYRRDPDLQEVHRQHPFIVVWDDHEFTNDPYEAGSGAENHQTETEGAWSKRVEVAVQAYEEWMPIRVDTPSKIWRNLPFGELASIVCLDIKYPLVRDLNEETPSKLGAEQSAWLDNAIATNQSKWLILAQQQTFTTGRNASGRGSSSWDSHPQSRERIKNACESAQTENVVVLTGDIHQARACDIAEDPHALYNPETGDGSWGVEVISSSITSPGFGSDLTGLPHQFWSEGLMRGYMILDLQLDAMQVDWFGYFDPWKAYTDLPEEDHWKSFRTESGANHLVEVEKPMSGKVNPPLLAPAPEPPPERGASN